MNPHHPTDARTKAPTAIEVLRLCADAAPDLWFPSAFSFQSGIDRESLNEPVWTLVKAGLVSVAGWTKGRGQGFAVTPAGLQMLADPKQQLDIQTVRTARPGDGQPNPLGDARGNFTPFDRGEVTRRAFLFPRASIVVPAILCACVVWFFVGAIVTWKAGGSVSNYVREGDVNVLRRLGAISGPELLRGDWWRLLTAGFVHIGIIHLLLNLFALSTLGPIAESLWGRWRFALLYLITGIGGMAAAAAIHPNNVTAGASCSIWGISVAILIWLLRYRSHLPPAIAGEWRQFLMMIGMNAVLSLIPGVSWEGHFFGGLTGVFAGVFLDWTRPGTRKRRIAAGAVGTVAVLVGIVGALLAMSYSSPVWKNLRNPRNGGNVAPAPPPNVTITVDVNQLRKALHPDRLHQLRKSMVVAALIPNGAANKTAREQLQQLRAEVNLATNVAAALPPEARAAFLAYLTEVRAGADLIEAGLNAGRLPTKEQREQLDAQLERAEQAWTAITPD